MAANCTVTVAVDDVPSTLRAVAVNPDADAPDDIATHTVVPDVETTTLGVAVNRPTGKVTAAVADTAADTLTLT
jgi:hypothetical protein